MVDTVTISAAFLIGFLGGAHCIGMCGGIMGALAMAVPPEQRRPGKLVPILLCYNTGRIISYSIAGGILGALGWFLSDQFNHAGIVLRYIAGLMLIAMGLYLASWWTGLRHLEKAGYALWQKIQPVIKQLMPVKSPLHAMLIGSLWGWLPCGLLYSALSWSAAAGSWQDAMALMFFFGLGTLPAVMATGIFLDRVRAFIQSRAIRSGAAILVIAYGIWTLPVTSTLLMDHESHAHGSQGQHQDHSSHKHQDINTDINTSPNNPSQHHH